jgi:dTDP-4-dehydrorhamnose reductase
MLGHQLMYSLRDSHQLKCTLRRNASEYGALGIFNESNAYFESDIRDLHRLEAIVDEFQPDVIVNCVGIVKQRPESEERILSIEINALAPHKVARFCDARDIRFIHISTDCVFDGRTGGYTESDPCNVTDVYGLTKYLGEVSEPPAITLRTSIVGHELSRKTGLLEWFLSQDGQVRGFKRAVYSGVTTNELANVIDMLATKYEDASGLYHVSSDPITKHDLLGLFKDAYARGVSIEPDESFVCDRSLNSDLFRDSFDYAPPDWPSMVQLMKDEFEGRSNEL